MQFWHFLKVFAQFWHFLMVIASFSDCFCAGHSCHNNNTEILQTNISSFFAGFRKTNMKGAVCTQGWHARFLFENRASLFKKNSESTTASKHLRAVKVLSPTLLAEEASEHSTVVIQELQCSSLNSFRSIVRKLFFSAVKRK